jgi:hypothetical protein
VSAAIPVTVDNLVRAETDWYLGNFVKRSGLGKLVHLRELRPIEVPGVRPNRDTLYSQGVFDLDAAPVAITLPDAGKRYMAMQVIDQDHYTYGVYYGGSRQVFTREEIGTRYVLLAIRTLIDPANPADVAQVHALQDAMRVEQESAGSFDVPRWDEESQESVRDALLALNATLPDLRRGAGRRDEVDPIRHLIATASGWGLNPDEAAIYLNVTPSHNDGTVVYRLVVRDVPVDGFWSISVYDAEGHFVKNAYDAYTLNNITAQREPDGSVAVQFGGCEAATPNCLPIMPGWNYMVRLYRPREEILRGAWEFPRAHRCTAAAPWHLRRTGFRRKEEACAGRFCSRWRSRPPRSSSSRRSLRPTGSPSTTPSSWTGAS